MGAKKRAGAYWREYLGHTHKSLLSACYVSVFLAYPCTWPSTYVAASWNLYDRRNEVVAVWKKIP